MLYGAARMESVKVRCEVDADPSDVTFTWSFNNSNENMQITNHIADGASSTVTYTPKTEYDYGTLYCWGGNAIGTQREPCIFTVIPAGPPDPVRNCSLINQTEDSIRVDCAEGYDGGLMQHFVMEVYLSSSLSPASPASPAASASSSDVNPYHHLPHRHPLYQSSVLLHNITSNWPSWVAHGLPPGTELSLNLYAVNSKGRSKSEILAAATASLPESMNRLARGQSWQFTFSPFLAILITVVTVIVIIAFIIIMIFKICPESGSKRKKHNGE